MERIGKYFEFGYPHFYRGVDYSWPNQEINFDKGIKERRDELGEFLLEKTRAYIKDFSAGKERGPYPYLQTGEKGLALHMGDRGRWIEVWKTIGANFLGEHNLDSYIDRMVCFNSGYDTLEFFDKTILTPKAVKQREKYSVEYPLPKGLEVIPESSHLNPETLQRLFRLIGLDANLQLTLTTSHQEIRNSQGVIDIKEGICEAKDFEGWSLPKASWVASRLMSLCREF